MATSERDWCDPLSTYHALRDRGAVLLHGAGAHPDAATSIIALHPSWTATIDDDLRILHADGRIETHDGPQLELLRRLSNGMRRDVHESDPFTGGLVGSIGYEFLHAIEPTLPRRRAGTPDVWLRLCHDAIVIDHQQRQTRIHIDAQDVAGATPEQRLAAIGAALTSTPHAAQLDDDDAPWTPSLDADQHAAEVARLRDLIAEGDLFQANIATRWSRPSTADPLALFGALANTNPSPFMALIEADDHAIVSCSPERLFDVRDGRITTRPIAGTRRRGAHADEDERLAEELHEDPKERAEHTMLVDLLRNDIAKVAVPGTVHVPEFASIERYSHVMHLVSRVDGDVRPGTDFVDWLAALFPGGTITGAPKHRACLRIHEAEPVARGPYTGSAGYLSWSHNAQWNIMIRTIVMHDGHAHVHAGGGIVADSQDRNEWDEAGHKARALLDATRRGAARADRVGEVQAMDQWSPARPGRVDARVLLIDNYDSFTYNLADQCASLGADVAVVRNDADWRAAAATLHPTHIILSPGPGRPEDSGATLEVLRDGPDIPVLGVCLGHQAMGHVTGARIATVAPVHGKPAAVHHDAAWLAGIASPFTAARYHSLIVARDGLPSDWIIDAWLDDGTIMAMRHQERPWLGLQVHPESICSPEGLDILTRFLDGRCRLR